MTVKIFLVGLPAMLLCLVVQTVVTFWCVRYYVRQSVLRSAQVHLRRGRLPGIRPLVVVMLVMMVGNLFQIALWGGAVRRARRIRHAL